MCTTVVNYSASFSKLSSITVCGHYRCDKIVYFVNAQASETLVVLTFGCLWPTEMKKAAKLPPLKKATIGGWNGWSKFHWLVPSEIYMKHVTHILCIPPNPMTWLCLTWYCLILCNFAWCIPIRQNRIYAIQVPTCMLLLSSKMISYRYCVYNTGTYIPYFIDQTPQLLSFYATQCGIYLRAASIREQHSLAMCYVSPQAWPTICSSHKTITFISLLKLKLRQNSSHRYYLRESRARDKAIARPQLGYVRAPSVIYRRWRTSKRT